METKKKQLAAQLTLQDEKDAQRAVLTAARRAQQLQTDEALMQRTRQDLKKQQDELRKASQKLEQAEKAHG